MPAAAMADPLLQAWLETLEGQRSGQAGARADAEAELLRQALEAQATQDLAALDLADDQALREVVDQAISRAWARASADRVAPRHKAWRAKLAERLARWLAVPIAGTWRPAGAGALLVGLVAGVVWWEREAREPGLDAGPHWRGSEEGIHEQLVHADRPAAEAATLARQLRDAGATVVETTDGQALLLQIDVRGGGREVLADRWRAMGLPGRPADRVQLVFVPR